MNAKNILTVGIAYEPVRGGVAAVESVYSTFYEPFNHISTAAAGGQVKKLFVWMKGLTQFVWQMLTNKEIKIVHVHGASDASFTRKRIIIRLAKRFGKKVVYHCHGAEFKRFTADHKESVRETMAKCDCVIALSESWKEWFQTELGCKNVVVIKNVIAKAELHYDNVNENENHPASDNVFKMLFLGRLGQRKGIYDLLEVLTANKDRYEGKAKLICGGDGEIEKVNEIVKENGLESMFEYVGWVSGDKKVELLNKADAYVLPSYNEGLPISVLEAMSYHLPIISTTVGGIPEILTDGDNGFIMEPGDKAALTNAIDALLNDIDLRKKMGKRSAEIVVPHLPDYVEKQLTELYKRLV